MIISKEEKPEYQNKPWENRYIPRSLDRERKWNTRKNQYRKKKGEKKGRRRHGKKWQSIRQSSYQHCSTDERVVSKMRRLQASMEMKYLRAVKGFTHIDRWRNEQIREEFDIEVPHIIIEGNQMKLFGHINRMKKQRKVNILLKYNCSIYVRLVLNFLILISLLWGNVSILELLI